MDELRENEKHSKETAFSQGYIRYAMILLFCIFTLNFLDRQIVNILAEPIKRELNLADWQLGSLTGLSFAIFYATLALPIARLAERSDRVKIIAACTITWSVFTALCGMAQNFAQLFLARVGVGIGEAGCTPTSHSLISDYTTREKRASALAVFSLGIPVGSLIGMTLGGLLADTYGWRAAFLLIGLPGILVGLLAYVTLPEPRRAEPGRVVAPPSLKQAVRELRANRTYVRITLAQAMMSYVGFGQLAFHSSFYLRNHLSGLEALAAKTNALLGLDLGVTGFLGTALGLVIGIFGAIGTWVGGWIADRAVRRDIRGYATVPALSTFCLPFTILVTYLIPNTLAALVFLGIPMLLHSLYYGPVFASVQSLVRPEIRATAAAFFFFIATLVGLGLGPLSVGALSDFLARDLGSGGGIRWSLIITSFAYLIGAGAFWMARRTIRKDIVS